MGYCSARIAFSFLGARLKGELGFTDHRCALLIAPPRQHRLHKHNKKRKKTKLHIVPERERVNKATSYKTETII